MSIGNVVKHVNIPFETIVSVALWDLPGREEMDLRRSYYKDVDAAIGKNYNLECMHTQLYPGSRGPLIFLEKLGRGFLERSN